MRVQHDPSVTFGTHLLMLRVLVTVRVRLSACTRDCTSVEMYARVQRLAGEKGVSEAQ